MKTTAVLITLGLLLAGGPAVHTLAADDWHTVKIPSSGNADLEVLADELGFFAAKGVKPEFVGQLPPGTSTAVALATGIIDVISVGHADYVIVGRQAGAKIKIIGMSADATKDYPHMGYFVRTDSPIHTAKDLIGKKVAGLSGKGDGVNISACTGFGTAEYLDQAGIDIRKADIEGVNIPVPQMIQALKQGLIDVGVFHPPLLGLVARTPGFRKVFDDYQVLNHLYGKGATRVVTASEKWIKRDPAGVRAYLDAMVLAADWALAHEEESKYIFNKRMDYNLTKPEDIHNLDVYRWMPHQKIVEKEDIQVFVDLMLKYGVIKSPAPDPKDFYTDEFNTYTTLLKEGKTTPAAILKEAEAIAAKNFPSYIKKV